MIDIDYPALYTKITKEAIQTRGIIINHFCIFEQEIMDVIILEWAFDNDQERETFIEKNANWKLRMQDKQKLLKKGIKKYQEKYKEELTGLYESLDKLIESRNVLAHWMADVSDSGIEHFYKTNSIRFLSPNLQYVINLSEKNPHKEFFFDMNKLEELKIEMDNARDQLIKIRKKIID